MVCGHPIDSDGCRSPTDHQSKYFNAIGKKNNMIQSSLYMANIEQAGALNAESITDVGHIL